MADVQKSAFSLSSATVMMAPYGGKDVFALDPTTDSVGMVSEVKVSVDSNITELANGVSQALVDSKRTGVRASVTANIFEFTAKNFMLSQAISGTPVQVKRGVLTAALTAGATSISVSSSPVPGETASAITGNADIPLGSTLLIQRTDSTDYVFPTVSSGAATGSAGVYNVPLDATHAIPTTMTFPIGAYVWIVQQVGGGQIDSDDLFGVKVVGTLSNFSRPVVCVLPKVRVVKGFELTFSETQYSSMPWELSPLLLSASEASTGRLAEVGTKRPFLLYTGA